MSLSTPGFFIVGCWNKDIPVPWKELFGRIELGLCSILSRAAVVKTWDFSVGGQIILSVLWWVIRSFQVQLTIPLQAYMKLMYQDYAVFQLNLSSELLHALIYLNKLPNDFLKLLNGGFHFLSSHSVRLMLFWTISCEIVIVDGVSCLCELFILLPCKILSTNDFKDCGRKCCWQFLAKFPLELLSINKISKFCCFGKNKCFIIVALFIKCFKNCPSIVIKCKIAVIITILKFFQIFNMQHKSLF